MDVLTLDVVKEHLGYLPSPPASPLLVSQPSQDAFMSSGWTEPEDMDGSQLNKSDNENVLVTLEEASQKISCDEVYRAPTDQTMDIDVHSRNHSGKTKQKRSHSSDSPRQPLRQINNTMQLEGRSPGPSKLSLNRGGQQTRVSKFND